MVYRTRYMAAFGLLGIASIVSGQSDPELADPPDSVRNQLDVSGSSLADLDFTGDCVPTLRDFAVVVYLELKAKGLLEVDTDGDGELTANDTILQIRKIIAASVADPDQNGVTDATDLSVVVDDIISNVNDPGADVTQDGEVDGSDILLVGDQISRTNVVDFVKAADAIYGYIGLIAPLVDDGSLGWHTAQTSGDCNGFGGENWPDDDQHYPRTSQLYPPVSEHQVLISRIYPPNHSISVSVRWPNPEYSNPLFEPPHFDWPDNVENWPPNHFTEASASWDDDWPDGPGEHSEQHSLRWRSKPGHFYSVSSTWPTDLYLHSIELSERWPVNHAEIVSREGLMPTPAGHVMAISVGWHPSGISGHLAVVSGRWPPSHTRVVSQNWGTHLIAWSVSWPANHQGSTSSGWPVDFYPNWPANHNGITTRSDHQQGPPIPPAIFPPDHTYFTTIRDILSIPFPDYIWPPIP